MTAIALLILMISKLQPEQSHRKNDSLEIPKLLLY